MERKEILTALLYKLVPYRSRAVGILEMLVTLDVDDILLDEIIVFLGDHIRTITQQHKKEILEKSMTMVQKIRQQEQQNVDQEEAEDLLAMLDHIDDG